MWHTSQGDRTLTGAEAEIVAHSVDTMIDNLIQFIDDEGADDDWEANAGACQSGITIYDALPPTSRIALLREVAKHLLTETPEPMTVCAYSEAAVGAIFVEVRDHVAIEIDLFPDGPDEPSDDPEENVTWRELVLAAYHAAYPTTNWQDDESWRNEIRIPRASCLELEQWEPLIDLLADAVLWDRDFELAGDFLDAEPTRSRQRKRLLGIDNDYFASIVPDPQGSEVFRLINETRSIVRAKPR